MLLNTVNTYNNEFIINNNEFIINNVKFFRRDLLKWTSKRHVHFNIMLYIFGKNMIQLQHCRYLFINSCFKLPT